MSLLLGRFGTAIGGQYPDVLPLTLWWRDYTFPLPWNSTKSYGTSGGKAFDFFEGSPSVGSPVNGHVPVDIGQNTPDRLRANLVTLPQVLSPDFYEGWVLIKFDSLALGPSSAGGIMGHAGGTTPGEDTAVGAWYLSASGGTIDVRHGGVPIVNSGIPNTTNFHLVQFRYDAATTTASMRTDDGAWNTNTSATTPWYNPPTVSTGQFKIGNVNLISSTAIPVETPNPGYTPSTKGCSILELGIVNRYGIINFDLLRAYVTTRYGISV